MSANPIRVRCEGAGSGHVIPFGVMCQMCGAVFSRRLDDALGQSLTTVPEHDRDDIVAMVDRGDFG